MSLAGIKEWLSHTYGADVTSVPEREVVARAAAILRAPVAGLSPGAAIALVQMRIDAAIVDYERDEKGQFASTGGGGSSAEPKEKAPKVEAKEPFRSKSGDTNRQSQERMSRSRSEALDLKTKIHSALEDNDLSKADEHLKALGAVRSHVDEHELDDRRANDHDLRSSWKDAREVRDIHDNASSAVQETKEAVAARQRGEVPSLTHAQYNRSADDFEKRTDPAHHPAFSAYSSRTDQAINRMLRTTGGQIDVTKAVNNHGVRMSEKDLPHIDIMNKVIEASPLKEDTKVFRVVSDKDGGMFKSLQPGAVFKDHGFTSTTASRPVLDKYYQGPKSDRVDMHITLKKGSGAAAINNLSHYKGERELLLGSGQSFRVTKAGPENGVHTVHMERI